MNGLVWCSVLLHWSFSKDVHIFSCVTSCGSNPEVPVCGTCCRIWLKFAVEFIFILALVIFFNNDHPFLHQQTKIPINRQRGVMRMYMYYNSTWGFPTAGADREKERGERGTCVIVDPCSSNTSVSRNRPGKSMCFQIKLWIRSIQVWAVLESAARKL